MNNYADRSTRGPTCFLSSSEGLDTRFGFPPDQKTQKYSVEPGSKVGPTLCATAADEDQAGEPLGHFQLLRFTDAVTTAWENRENWSLLKRGFYNRWKQHNKMQTIELHCCFKHIWFYHLTSKKWKDLIFLYVGIAKNMQFATSAWFSHAGSHGITSAWYEPRDHSTIPCWDSDIYMCFFSALFLRWWCCVTRALVYMLYYQNWSLCLFYIFLAKNPPNIEVHGIVVCVYVCVRMRALVSIGLKNKLWKTVLIWTCKHVEYQ